MSQIAKFFTSKTFVTQLGMIVVLLFGIFFFTYRWLNAYTNHGETITVPDLRGMKLEQLNAFLESKHLQVKVSDSTSYLLDKEPGTVIEQDPAANDKVKEGRTIYVTITKKVPPGVKLPNLVDVSRRQAEAMLASYGLVVGSITYKPDLAKDAVLSFIVKGVTMSPGTQVPKGTVVDLVLGDGLGNTEVTIPQLVGLSLDEALFVLQGSQLVPGQTLFDAGVKDTSKAVIYKQVPDPADTTVIHQGESIDLYLH